MLKQLLVFVLVLVALNAIFYVLDIPIHISIIGSLVLSAVVSGIMNFLQRR